MDTNLLNWLVIALAGFLGGGLNAVAGGGSFITLPALVFAGVPPVAANATGTAALLPGYMASTWRFRKDIEFPAQMGVKVLILISLVGGSLGAGILLMTTEAVFSALVPWLILLATCAFVVGPKWVQASSAGQPKQLHIGISASVLLAVCVYGGYFNGGLGIILLAALGLLGQTNLNGMNGLKNLISTLLTVVAVIVYGLGGVIHLAPLVVLGLGAIVGGYAGAAVAYKIKPSVMRGFIVVVGLVMATLFFLMQGGVIQ